MEARLMNRAIRNIITVILLSIICVALHAQDKPSGESAKSFIEFLASDALEGRDTGTPGFEKAAAWVADKFKSWGLQPAGDNGSYVQEFPFSYFKHEFDYPKLTIGRRIFHPEDRDFSVLRFSGSGSVQDEIVFIGFGISAPQLGLDEYAGLDVKNKIVLVMHGCPQNDEKKWEGLFEDSAKVAVAQAKGAIGVLICASFGEQERGIGYWWLRPENYREKFIAFGVDERVVNFVLKQKDETNTAFQRRLREQFDNLNNNLQPMSLATGKKARMEVKTEYDPQRMGKNVLGMIKGIDPVVGDEAIVLGAHLDHIGVHYGQINNGADDNASGSAVVMEVARVMMANKIQPKRTIIFACWGGEERGLLGSSYYAKNQTAFIEKTVLNFNMDMVGLGEKLGFPGIYYAPEIWQIIKTHADSATLAFIEPSRGGPGGSDHTPFITRGVPAFALMTTPWNAHPDYHQPGDDSEKINAELLGKVAQFVYNKALLIANHDDDLIVEHRLPRYIHKSANVINIHPIAYHNGLALLDSLQKEWIDIQFVTIPLDSLKEPSAQLAKVFKSLDAASQETSDISQAMGAMARMYRTRSEKTTSIIGIAGAASVNNEVANLRIAGKLGAKFFTLDGIDGTWIAPDEGLTPDGKKAIKELNNQKMMIVLKNLPELALMQILETSKHPVVIAGVKGIDTVSDSLIEKVTEKQALLALAFCPDNIEPLVEKIEAFKQKTRLSNLGLYPCPGKALDIENLDQMLNLTIALHQKGYRDNEIKDILGNNLQAIFNKINPSEQRRMRRPF